MILNKLTPVTPLSPRSEENGDDRRVLPELPPLPGVASTPTPPADSPSRQLHVSVDTGPKEPRFKQGGVTFAVPDLGDKSDDSDSCENIFGQDEDDEVPLRSDGEGELDGGESRMTTASQAEEAHDEGHGGHGHGEHAPSIMTAIPSALINYMLMFGLCSAYGMIMFYDDSLAIHRGLGVKMCLSTAFFTGLMLAWQSRIGVAIGGTDLNPVVFLGGMVTSISESIQADIGLVSPTRRLGSSGGAVTCMGEHYLLHRADCDLFHEKVRATVIFTVTFTSFLLGLIFFGLGRFKATRLVTYVPTSIMEAFLSCVGYKVFKYALKFCNYDPTQFIPAAIIGVMLYFMKAMHIGNPAIVIPLTLLIPLGFFYIYIFAIKGEDLTIARKDELMFPVIENIPFWNIWTDSIGKADKIDFKAWASTLSDLVIMIIVVVLDCLLKISSTESKLPVQVAKDYEIQLAGISNIFSVLTGSTVGYMQLKFNVINYGVMGNVRDRRAGVMYAILCGVGFFTTIEHFNFLPRFFLGMLLFFAGAGFVAENLWGSRKYLSLREWSQILVILAVFIATGQLLIAVIVGGLLTGFDFILRYAKVSCIAGRPLGGGEVPMIVRQQPLLQRNLQHIANNWLLVIRLKGYIFFASATSVVHHMKQKFAEQLNVPEYRRLRFIVFDCEQLDGMDASASKSMKKLVEEAAKVNIRCLWSHMSEDIKEQLVTRTIVQDAADLYDDVTQAVDFVHKMAMDYRVEIQRRFMSLHPAFGVYRGLSCSRASFEPFAWCFNLDIQRFGCPWHYCTVMKIEKRKTVIHGIDERVMDLFLVHSGAVGIFAEDPIEAVRENKMRRAGDIEKMVDPWLCPGPRAIYKQGWFLNREMLSGAQTKHHAIAMEDGEVLCWSERDWIRMAREQPYMARAISKMIIKQQSRDDELKNMEISSNSVDQSPIDLMEQNEASTFAGGGVRMRRTKTFIPKKKSKGSSASKTLVNPANLRRVSQVLETAKIFNMVAAQGNGPRPGCPLGLGLPEEMVGKLVGVQTAQVLDGFDLYKGTASVEDEDVVLPPMPKGFRENLDIAFSTYCRHEDGQETTICWSACDNALMFAGIFNTVLDKNLPPRRSLTKDEFMAIGHRATMSPLCVTQVKTIKDIFDRWDENSNGRLDREQLISVFREVFHPELSIEEVEGMSAVWGVNALERMDFLDFLCTFSRFLRIHEQDWSLLSGFYELMGQRQCTETDTLRAKEVVNHSQGQISLAHAEEMLWACDWRRDGEGGGKSLPFIDLIAAVMMNVGLHPGHLPPDHRSGQKDARASSKPYTVHSCGILQEASGTDFGETHTRYVFLKRAEPGGSFMRSVVPDMQMKDDPVMTEVEGMVQDLRDVVGVCSSRMSEMLNKQASNVEENVNVSHGSILEGMLRQQQAAADVAKMSNLRRQATSMAGAKMLHMETKIELAKQMVELEGFRQQVFGLCELPASSASAQYLSIFMGAMIVLSVMIIFLEPLITPPRQTKTETEKLTWQVIETCFTLVFTVEFIIRCAVASAVAPNTLADFFKTPSNICDFAALMPFYVELILSNTQDGLRLLRTARLMKLVRLLRVSRVMRLNKLARHGTGAAALAGPVSMVFTVIWGIYLLSGDD